jgi:hypothetical protein
VCTLVVESSFAQSNYIGLILLHLTSPKTRFPVPRRNIVQPDSKALIDCFYMQVISIRRFNHGSDRLPTMEPSSPHQFHQMTIATLSISRPFHLTIHRYLPACASFLNRIKSHSTQARHTTNLL